MNDSDLKYIQRVLESNAPDEDRERAAQMVRDIRRSYGQAPAHLLERLRRHAADTTNTAFSRAAITEALQYLEAAQAPAANGDALDAARYRWLRSDRARVSNVIDREYAPGYWEYRCGEELDAAIDTAMQRTSDGGAA